VCVACSEAELKERQVETLDICEAYHDKSAKDYRADYDSSLFRSEKTARGPLRKGWQSTAAPVMTCYKVCRLDFKYWGMQTKVNCVFHFVRLGCNWRPLYPLGVCAG
jgi:Phosphatidylinositol transfer protein